MKELRSANLETLTQIEELISSFASNDTATDSLYTSSGIGRHVRHLIDHYLTFIEGINQGLVDYNVRHRNSAVESDQLLAMELIADIKTWIRDTDLLQPQVLTIVSEVSSLKSSNVSIESNVERELHYLAYHGIHHVAYCSLLAAQAGLVVDPAIGLAPGTASYQRSLQA